MAEHAPSEAALNPSALSPSAAAALLSRAGGEPVSEADIRGDIEAGAPVNDDGTINLVHYAAWLAKQTGGGRPETGGEDR